MAIRAFLGTWEVMKFNYNNGIHAENSGLEGVKFRLDETGDVTWTVNEELKTVPLFSCETYELYSTTSGIILVVILRFGAYAGHVIEFRCDQSTVDQLWVALRKGEQMEHMSLTCEGWCILQCKRIIDEPKENNNHIPFSLLPALEDGYFSDVIIMASNKKHFKVHSNILQLLGITIPWQSNPVPFSNLPENVLGTILHFLYSECLPNSLDEATAHEVIQAVQSYPCLSKLVDMCKLYLKNTALKQQIIGLVNDMHASINQVIDHFNNRNTLSPTEITSNPENLCYVIKQSVREAAVASAKLLMLCDLFTKRKNELSRDERHEIIIYAKSRLPIFLMQLLKFLQAFKSTFSTMSPSQRQEVAMFLVPEIEIILDTVSMIILEIERALQQIIQVLSPHETPKPKTSMGDMLGKSLKNVLHIREITKLRNIHEQITCTLELLLSKKEHFNEMTPSQKVRSVARNLEQVIEELPIFLFRLEELTAALDDKVEWREFKFCFKVGTSKVSGILQKLVAHRETLQDVLIQVCELVQREQFTQSMQNLQLLSVPSTRSHSSECPKGSKANSFDTPNSHQHQSYKLSLVESLCIPPTSLESNLSKLSLQLLNSGIGTDMEFEVVSNNSSVQQTMREHSNEAVSPIEDERTVMKAHRVIVASRCDWFRRALLSGMREAIDKKIVIHDTNSFLFKVFLEYLYSGRIKQSGLSNEQYAELLLLSDRYEVDSLKQCCEYALKSSIDLESVLYYLSMADQFNARYLRNACLSFISQNHQLAETELFYELPIALQAEIFNCIWSQPPTHKSSSIDQPLATPSSPDTSLSDIPKGLSEVNLAGQQAHSNCSSMEDFPSEDTVRLEQCISKLRDILGDSAPREKLVQIVLAADYDMCRAINYFYERNGDDE